MAGTMCSGRFVAALTAALLAITPSLASAELANYALTAWTNEQGLPPGDVLAMTQDPAGYLWLGTTAGLVRFDGVQFAPWSSRVLTLPGVAISALISARDGSIWLGYGDAQGVTRLRDGKIMRSYGEDDGLKQCTVTTMMEDRHDTIWAGCETGLAMFQGSHWQVVGPERGLPPHEVSGLYEDHAGTLWVATTAGIFRRRPNEDSFELYDPRSTYVQSLAEDDAGVLWASDSRRIVHRLDEAQSPILSPEILVPSAGWRLLRDEHGAIWVAALGGGLARLERLPDGTSRIERVRYESKLAGSPRSLYRDSENNIWVGMRGGGLLRLSETVVNTNHPLDGLTNDGVRALAAAPDGSVWVATGHSLNRFSGATRTGVYRLAQTLALHADRHGNLWAATVQAVGRVVGGHLLPIRVTPNLVLERTASITSDTTQSLWLCAREYGVFTTQHGILAPFENQPGISGRACTFLYTDSRGRIWIGFSRGGVALYDRGETHLFGAKEGLSDGSVLSIVEDLTGVVWVGTSAGVSRFEGAQFIKVTLEDGLPGKPMGALADDADGFLWVGVDSGAAMVRFSRREFDRLIGDRSAHDLRYTVFDATDGLAGAIHWGSRPAAVRDTTGRIWFVTGDGIAEVDPRQVGPVHRPSLPRVEAVMINGRSIDPGTLAAFPSSSSMDIRYTSVNLSAASKVRFRYVLEGLGHDWTDAGSARTASFANLPAGRYRFRLRASTDGVWTGSDYTWEFVVRPPFYQTSGFYLLLAVLVATLMWTYWRLRLRAVRTQFSLIVAERARVSREIHDTLLQSLGAVGVELEIVASQLPRSQSLATEALSRLRREVRRCIREARESIWELRSSRLEAHDLPKALRELAEDIGTARAVQVDVVVTGRFRRPRPDVDEHLLRIAQEAILNGIRHGHAKRIEVLLRCERESISLRVSDDGHGFAPADYDKPDGEHWGLTNMKERAERIAGRFTVASGPAGTIVETLVPHVRGS
jgi:signal transduction histidine kinase/ligand-binding sensor domain-containing protein